MCKRLSLFFSVSLLSLLVHAQWSQKDSLALQHLLDGDGEIKLNRNVLKNIDTGTFIGEQVMADEKPALNFDTTLPKVFPERKELKLSLRPYTANTKYNYDPIYQRKIAIKEDTWKYGDRFRLRMVLIPTNWAKTPFDPKIRNSVEEIEATGLRYNPLAGRANNVAVGAWGTAGGGGMNVDMMAPFTKDFWDRKGRKRRERTLELLQSYGDSTTTQIREEIKPIVH